MLNRVNTVRKIFNQQCFQPCLLFLKESGSCIPNRYNTTVMLQYVYKAFPPKYSCSSSFSVHSLTHVTRFMHKIENNGIRLLL